MTKDYTIESQKNIIEAKDIEIKYLEDHIKKQNSAIKDLNQVINFYANKNKKDQSEQAKQKA